MLSLILALLLVPQTLSVTVPVNTPFQVSFDLPGSEVPNFRWWCDESIVKNFKAAEVTKAATPNADGSYTFTATVPGLAAGSHSCLVSAYNDVGESKATPIVFPVGAPAPIGKPPAVPVNIRIVVGVGGGQ